MKLIGHSLKGALGVEILPVISLIIFVILFVFLMFYAFRKDKNYLETMKNLPIESEDEMSQNDVEQVKI